jgi:hypothetical protein
MVLVAALLLMAFQPAPAEAMEPTVVLAIVGVAVAVVILIGYLVIANVDEARRADAAPAGVTPEVMVLVAYAPPETAGDAARHSAP